MLQNIDKTAKPTPKLRHECLAHKDQADSQNKSESKTTAFQVGSSFSTYGSESSIAGRCATRNMNTDDCPSSYMSPVPPSQNTEHVSSSIIESSQNERKGNRFLAQGRIHATNHNTGKPPRFSRRRLRRDSEDSVQINDEACAEASHHNEQLPSQAQNPSRRRIKSSNHRPPKERRPADRQTSIVPHSTHARSAHNLSTNEQENCNVNKKSSHCRKKQNAKSLARATIPSTSVAICGSENLQKLSTSNKLGSSRNKERKHVRRRRNPTTRRYCAFLDKLPGEIRNKIYEHVIPQARVMICASSPKAEVAAAQKLWVNEGKHITQPRSHLYHLRDRNQIEDGLVISIDLLLVNKQISQELSHFLYSRTKFCFSSLRVLGKFLSSCSAMGMASVSSIEMAIDCYGQPKLNENSIFKTRYDRKWHSVCTLLGTKTPYLLELKVHCRFTEWPFWKVEQTPWYAGFKQLVQQRKIRNVEVQLSHPRFSTRKLDRITHRMVEVMTTPEGLVEKQNRLTCKTLKLVEQIDKACAKPFPAAAITKSLRIVVGDNEQGAQTSTQDTNVITITVPVAKKTDATTEQPVNSERAESKPVPGSNTEDENSIPTQLMKYRQHRREEELNRIANLGKAQRLCASTKKWKVKYGPAHKVKVELKGS